MKNKKGSGYMLSCVLIIFICSFISVFLTYFSTVHIVTVSRKDARTVLDSYVTSDSVEIFNGLKNSSDSIDSVDSEAFKTNLSEYCGLEENGELLYCYDAEGAERYHISEPELNFVTTDRLRLRASYEITVPLWLFGSRLTEITVPITVDSLYNNKF